MIGSGIAGNTAARLLRDSHDITVYESQGYAGGHTNTVDVPTANGTIPIDTGFIVLNDPYITVTDCWAVTNAGSQRCMSFSVQSEADGLEYNGASLNTLFAQRRNLLKPSFWRMVRDILRFNREALAALHGNEGNLSLGAWLDRHRYSPEFTGHYLVPMAAAIWSSEPGIVQQMPLKFLVRFFQNHGLLQLNQPSNSPGSPAT
ncbi:MAG: NAD(P)-binding protein [Woeseiaceae bacterium]|nr:NAD(P)-binding protein [Woeseiaceae bacterium]